MNSSTLFAAAGFALALVFASLLFAAELKGILKSGKRRNNALPKAPAQPEYTPSGLPFWMSEKFLALSAATVAFAVILLTK